LKDYSSSFNIIKIKVGFSHLLFLPLNQSKKMFVYQTQLEGTIKGIIEETLASMGYELVRVRLKGGSGRKTLQVMLDRIDGQSITIGDCQKASDRISVLLDVQDPIESRFTLEVSSPGLNRPLTRHKDFVNSIGKTIKVITKLMVDERKNISGILKEVSDDIIIVHNTELNRDFNIKFHNILDSHLQIDFNNIFNNRTKRS
jgi:ribosome maturation factor RimP